MVNILIICSCIVDWGDGSKGSRGSSGVVENCIMYHTYSSDNDTYYTVEAAYCNILGGTPVRDCCSVLLKDIFITK